MLFAEDTDLTLRRNRTSTQQGEASNQRGMSGGQVPHQNTSDVLFDNHFEQIVELFSVAFRLLIRVINGTHSGYMQVGALLSRFTPRNSLPRTRTISSTDNTI